MNKKCKYCYGKGYYSVMSGLHGYSDFEMGVKGFDEYPTIKKIPCKCMKTKGNYRHYSKLNKGWRNVINANDRRRAEWFLAGSFLVIIMWILSL